MMTQPLDYIEYLSKEIGARPAGTEEERQAALYIADEFQKEVGFAASIEEFVSSSNIEGYRSILAMITIVVSVLAMLFYVLTIPALILALISAVIYVLEATGKPIVSRLLARGASQNVVAKYQPRGDTSEEKRGARTRKIVLLAHYDTGKVTPGVVRAVEGTGLPFGTICLVAMVAAAFLLLLRVFVGGTGGAGLLFVNVLTIVSIVILALPIIKTILYRAAPYNEGANNNASGVAALLEVASRISQGSVSEADLAEAENAVVHGEKAALESGVVPEDAALFYEVEPNDDGLDENASEEERLLAAKAAIAALTGQSIEQRVYATASTAHEERPAREVAVAVDADTSGRMASDTEATSSYPAGAGEASDAIGIAASDVVESAVVPEPEPSETGGFENAPSWFVAAQRNAKRSESSEPIQRSRYTSALSATEQELAKRERARVEEERVRRELELRERQEATRAAISGEAQDQMSNGAVAPAAVTEKPIEFAPIDVESYNDERAPIDLEPIEAPGSDGESTVLPARVGAAQELGDPGQTVAFVPEHLRALLHEQTADAAGRVAAELEARDARVDAGEAYAVDAVSDAAEPAIGVETVEGERSDANEAVVDAPLEAAELSGGVAAVDAANAAEPATAEADDGQAVRLNADALPEVGVGNDADKASAAERLVALPSVESEAASDEAIPETTNPSRSGLIRRLRTDVPSLSGSVGAKREPAKPRMRLTKADLPSLSGFMDPVSADDAHAVGESHKPRTRLTKADIPSLSGLIDPVVASKAEGDDAQPSSEAERPDIDLPAVDYDMEIPVSDELASAVAEAAEAISDEKAESVEAPAAGGARDPEPNEVTMPKSRAGGLFKRFRRKGSDPLEQTPQEWLDVDDDFEAREAGRARGGWESFNDDADAASDERKRSGNRAWEGGAFSRVRLGRVNMLSGAEESAGETAAEGAEAIEDQVLNEEIEQIYHFRNPQYDAEIWFVAIGSDTELHDGAKAFIEEHHNELRGAMFIEVESLGVGELCYVAEEGQFRKSKASSRIKRFTRDATEATGIALGQIKMCCDSVASTIQKAGFQAFHLTGVENGYPSLKGSADDVFENVDELIFEENVNYLAELLKQN